MFEGSKIDFASFLYLPINIPFGKTALYDPRWLGGVKQRPSETIFCFQTAFRQVMGDADIIGIAESSSQSACHTHSIGKICLYYGLFCINLRQISDFSSSVLSFITLIYGFGRQGLTAFAAVIDFWNRGNAFKESKAIRPDADGGAIIYLLEYANTFNIL